MSKVTMIATLIKAGLPDYNGSASLYRLDPPLDGNEFVVVSAASVSYSGDETYIFAADKDGDVTDWLELDGSYRGGLDHGHALSNAGYQVA